MTEKTFYYFLIILEIALSPFIAYALLRISAPYGRHARGNWGPTLHFKIAWFLMEAAAIISFCWTFFRGDMPYSPISLLFFVLWQLHYLDRAVIYTIQMPSTKKRMPILIMISGLLFNSSNGYLNARFLSAYGPGYSLEWLVDIRFIFGIILFASGFLINRFADRILFNLRKNNEKEYKIPHGFLYRYISCPNYLGEVVIWCGWALATWSLPGLAFAIFTAANLIPRAYTHHCWYRKHFVDYPSSRKAIIPFIL
jgi:protein-S-isoprenylcysteine O-methyltransferase Ste14